MKNKYNSCNNCKYFKRLHTRGDSNYTATIYGLCQKEKEFLQISIIAKITGKEISKINEKSKGTIYRKSKSEL